MNSTDTIDGGGLNLLIVGSDTDMTSACRELASSMGLNVVEVANLDAARLRIKHYLVDLILSHLAYKSQQDLDFVSELHLNHPKIIHIVMAASTSVRPVVEAMRAGASDYLPIPFTVEDLTSVMARAIERRKAQGLGSEIRGMLELPESASKLIIRSSGMEKIRAMLPRVAASTHPVLILGESGTGKEVVARTIHASGPNSIKPFLVVDCGSLAPTLIESELFGHVKGAFTGAISAKDGLLASAKGGTIFLDEVGELPLELQSRLLRALQEKEIRPIGSNRTQEIDARILAATNRDLPDMVSKGQFRKDLYYRLNIVSLRIPPLRERKEDIPMMTAHFLNRNSRHRDIRNKFTLDDEFLRAMMRHDWPGNVRELENVIDRACALADSSLLTVGELPTLLREAELASQSAGKNRPSRNHDVSHIEITPIAELERNAIINAIDTLGGDRIAAAKMLGIGKTTLYRKLKEFGVKLSS